MTRALRAHSAAHFLGPLAVCLGVVLLATSASVAPALHAATRAAASRDVTLTLDGTQTFQRIDGFGVNANARSWNGGQLAPALDVLVDSMNARIFRVILEKSDWQSAPDGSDPSTFNWSYYSALYESPKFQNLWGTIGYLNGKHVPLVMLSMMGTIPEWMGGATLNPDQEDEWVKMVASMVYYGRNVRQVQFSLLSPMNEQDVGSPEGPRVGPEQYARVMDKLSARLTALGLDDIQLVGPDTASVSAGATAYAPQLFARPGLMARIDHLSAHSYSADSGPMTSTLQQSPYGDRDVWMTEWSAWCPGCDAGRPVEAEWSFASSSTDLLLDHLEHGASAAIVYEGYDSYYEHHGAFSYWGQLAFNADTGTYTPRKRFYTNAQVFRFVLPGSVRIGSASSDSAVRALAFRDPSSGQLTIVGHNTRSSEATLQVSLDGVQVPGSILHLYQTTWTADLAQGPDAPVHEGMVSLTVAADGFFTVTSSGDAHPAAPPPAPESPQPVAAPGVAIPAAAIAQSGSSGNLLVGTPDVQGALDRNSAGVAEVFRSTASATGTANRLYLYLGGGTSAASVMVGAYADSAGRPGPLLASATIASPRGSAWNGVDLGSTAIERGTAYWIAVLAPAGGGSVELLDAGDSGATSLTSGGSSLSSLPAVWAGGTSWTSSPLSAYLTQEP